MEISKYILSEKLATEGAIVTLDDAQIRIASTASKKYRDARTELSKAARKKNAGLLSEDQVKELTITLLAENIILGWENITENGKPLPFSVTAAKSLLRQSEYFCDFISLQASEVETFSKAREAEGLKKLGEE